MAVTYTVRWRPTDADPGDAWSEETGLMEASYAVTGLTAGVQYDVEVIAVSDGVSSPATEGSSWTRCAAPAAVTTADVLAETATVSWTGVTGATAYRIERSTDGVTWTEAATTLDGATTSLGVTGLSESQGHRFRVVAENSVGDSAASTASAEVTTLAIATGGTTTLTGTAPNRYRVHTFADTGSTGFTLNATRDVEYLLVGGGGGGGARHGGGGGGGGMLTGRRSALAVGDYTVTVGGGGLGAQRNGPNGAADPVPAENGGDSTFDGLTALGGGAGGSWSDQVSKRNGAAGGSGGGAAVGDPGSGTPGAGLQPTSDDGGLGNPGGAPVAAQWPGTGGGGAGATGGSNGSGTGTATGGNGGAGSASSITGSSVDYAGGGGGAGSGTAGTGGAGGGGNGANGDLSGSEGSDGLGGGGGGARSDNASATCTGGNGGSGVVILRYLLTPGA